MVVPKGGSTAPREPPYLTAPVAGPAATLLGGLILSLWGLFWAISSLPYGSTYVSVAAVIDELGIYALGPLIASLGVIVYLRPTLRVPIGTAIVWLSFLSLFNGTFGGLFLGAVFGVAGGILCIIFEPYGDVGASDYQDPPRRGWPYRYWIITAGFLAIGTLLLAALFAVPISSCPSNTCPPGGACPAAIAYGGCSLSPLASLGTTFFLTAIVTAPISLRFHAEARRPRMVFP